MKSATSTAKFKLTKTIVTRFASASGQPGQAKSTSIIPTTFALPAR